MRSERGDDGWRRRRVDGMNELNEWMDRHSK